MNFIHPSQIVLEYYLGNPSFVVSSGKEEILRNIITDKIYITESIANLLAFVFLTSQEYWLNLQKQYDEKTSNKPLEEMFEIETDTFKGAQKTISESCVTKVLVGVHNEQGEEVVQPVYIITEQAYKYFVSKCTENEAWDLGWLSQSEKHAKEVEMPEALKRLIAAKKEERNKTDHGILNLEDMNKNPTKYATHILIADNSSLVIESTETCPQLLFIDNSWQPSNIYFKLLKPYIKE